MENKTLKLGEILCEEGLINHTQLLEVLKAQKQDHRKLGEILVEKGMISEARLLSIIANIHQVPFVDLAEIKIDPEAFLLAPISVFKKHKILPLQIEGQTLIVATNNPLDVSALQEIQDITEYQLKPVMASLQAIANYLDKFSANVLPVIVKQSPFK